MIKKKTILLQCFSFYFLKKEKKKKSGYRDESLPVLPSQRAIWLVLVRLTSAPCRPSLAAFDYLAVAVPFPSCHYFWQIIIKMTLSQCELLSHGQGNQTHTHTRGEYRRGACNTHNCALLMQNTHGHHTALTAGWGWAGLCADWLDEMWGLMDIYISLCFYTGRRIMYHSLGGTETYVSPYPLTDVIRFDFKRADQNLLMSNMSSKKTHTHAVQLPQTERHVGL